METASKILIVAELLTYNSDGLTTAMEELLPPAPWPGANKRLVLGGSFIEPAKRLATFSSDEFEIFARQWAHEYLKAVAGKYDRIEGAPGAGDKGRDIVAWIDSANADPRRWDAYQCKHYDHPLRPTEAWTELGKLCYYTYKGAYTVPEKYFFIALHGLGPDLLDLVGKPNALRSGLIDNWDKWCRAKITSTEVPLKGRLREYVDSFNFGIVDHVSVDELLEQHATTRYHAIVFGVALQPRPTPPPPPDAVAPNEARYVRHIYDAFADRLQRPVESTDDFSAEGYLADHFNHSRECFYCAESLEAFARDTLPPEVTCSSIRDEIAAGVRLTLLDPTHTDAYIRMLRVSEKAELLPLSAHMLSGELTSRDRVGMCHQLANADRITWMKR